MCNEPVWLHSIELIVLLDCLLSLLWKARARKEKDEVIELILEIKLGPLALTRSSAILKVVCLYKRKQGAKGRPGKAREKQL